MTIKQAAEIFHIDEKIIRKSIKDGMLEKRKNKRYIEIPNETTFIPVKNEIQAFLFQILKYKNNVHFPISRKLCPDIESLRILFEYLYHNGYIAEYQFSENISTLFDNIMLTDEAMELVFGKGKIAQINKVNNMPININATLKVGLNVG